MKKTNVRKQAKQTAQRKMWLHPSRWGTNPDEKIARHSLEYLLNRYAITLQSFRNDEYPTTCVVRMLELDQRKDLASSVEVVNYLDRIFAESWRRRQRRRAAPAA